MQAIFYTLFKTLRLLLPAVIPSWRFFDFIAPSPRVQYRLLSNIDELHDTWLEFRPRPKSISFPVMLKRMLWNPSWNESLFLVSCAERQVNEPSLHSENEILHRIATQLLHNADSREAKIDDSQFLQFRLVFVERIEDELEQSVLFHSRIEVLHEIKQR